VQVAFGLDIAGYSTGKSALARAVLAEDGVVDLTVYAGHVFSRRPKRGHFEEHVREEVAVLRGCLALGKVMVDCPIDLQELPTPPRVTEPWHLVKRPVDHALGGMPPLADRIGAPAARMNHLWRLVSAEAGDPLGSSLFETYPAGSLRLLGLPHRKYKDGDGAVTCREGRWGDTTLGTIATALGFEGEDGLRLSHDEVDAAVCALTGIFEGDYRLQERALEETIAERLSAKKRRKGRDASPARPPRGYVLLKDLPPLPKVRVEKCPWPSASAATAQGNGDLAHFPPIAQSDMDAVLQYLPVFERESYGFGERVDYSEGRPGVIAVATELLPDADAFFYDLYGHGWVVSFDWPSWSERMGTDYIESLEVVSEADLPTLRRLVTAHVRADRFSDGHFLHMLKTGYLTAVLRRLYELRRRPSPGSPYSEVEPI